MSDLDTEGKIPAHLHYRSSDSVDESFFMPKTRTRCVIHLHQLANKVSGGINCQCNPELYFRSKKHVLNKKAVLNS